MSDKLDAGFWFWLLRFVMAIGQWFKDIGPDATEPMEHVDSASPDAVPAPRKPIRHKVPPVDTRPGHFNRETGTWNE